jgi:hypothetical protein
MSVVNRLYVTVHLCDLLLNWQPLGGKDSLEALAQSRALSVGI